MDQKTYITWLMQHSMLTQATQINTNYSGHRRQWAHPYADTNPAAAAAKASIWFTAYPAAMITQPGQSVLDMLSDPDLWRTFQEIGISAMHTGPLKRAGGITETTFTPTIDGHFDRISMEIDPQFGTTDQYKTMVAAAAAQGITLIGDIVPLHSGKGADWRLAERGVGDYPGLYHMITIDQTDWELLPSVPEGQDSVNLKPAVVDQLAAKGYIIGQLPRVIFYDPGVKESNWSVTAPIEGIDGEVRRWVYLHYFKDGQPVFNWLDQTFAAQRLIAGDVLHSLGDLGVGMVRLDANGFLGVEKRPDGSIISEGHPLAVTGNQLIASLIRKAGGFSFQELNLTLEDLVAMGQGGADLSYDFVTRPAYHHALVSGDAGFLRLMLRLMHQYEIKPNELIHALQNHDELTLELVHFWTRHAESDFEFRGQTISGLSLRELIRQEMFSRCMGEAAPYNLQSTTNGIACTTASLVAAALGITDLDQLNEIDKARIKQLHLLLVVYNAFQPGIFALSGWDLIGALPLPADQVAHLMEDGDTRWINRGSYDLLGKGGEAGLPAATSLYGSLPDQLADPESFASHLKRLFALRERYRIFESEQVAILGEESLLVMVHKLPEGQELQLTAVNFGPEAVSQHISFQSEWNSHDQTLDLITGVSTQRVDQEGRLQIQLAGYHYALYLISRG